jgi:NhaC family Na+:H+ antiporter
MAAMNRPDTPQPQPQPQPQKLSMLEAAIPIVSLIALVALAYFLFGDAGALGPNQVALTIATMIAVFIGWRRGHSLESLGKAASDSVATGIGAVFILLAVGALIGTWALSGTLVAMVYYGLRLLSPDYFYVTACAISAAVAFSIGSPWTVAGTIGIGFMGIAASMGLNPGIAAGAIISGAYFGGLASPLSSAANMAAAVADVPLYTHVREALVTAGAALGVALLVYFMLGAPGDFDSSHKMDAIAAAFHVTPWLFLPLLVVIVLALYKFPPFTTIFLGALAGGIMAMIAAPGRVIAFADAPGLPAGLALVKGVWLALASGYVSTSGFQPMDDLASRGGMDSMLGTIWLIVTALGFGGVVEKAGVLDRLITPVIARARSDGALVASLAASVFATNAITADQFIAIVLPGRMFKKAFADRGLAPVMLSRSVGDTAIVTSALIPWNSCGAYMAATLGVATWSYAPFAILCLVAPVISVASACFGVRLLRVASKSISQPSGNCSIRWTRRRSAAANSIPQ